MSQFLNLNPVQPVVPDPSAELTRQTQNAAKKFYWIAALSVLNPFILKHYYEGFFTSLSFVIVFNMIVAAVFALCGFFAIKGERWAFATGIAFYLSGTIFTFLWLIIEATTYSPCSCGVNKSLWTLQDGIWLLVHVLFLFILFKGLQAINQLQKNNRT